MRGWRELLVRHKIRVKALEKSEEQILFYVQNGKDLLRQRYVSGEGKSLYTLLFGDVPLVRFHGDEYFCPTCQKLVSAGYGRGADALLGEVSEAVNAPFVSLADSFEALTPLLGLLEPGYYSLTERQLIPTDGAGRFFWAGLSNTPRPNPSTCPYNDPQSFDWFDTQPLFLLPTQAARHYSPQRAVYYQSKPECYALAFGLEGYLCAVLDGHHKATAAALAGRRVGTLLIEPARHVIFSEGVRCLRIAGREIPEHALPIPINTHYHRGTPKEMHRWLAVKNPEFDACPLPAGLLATAAQYPTLTELATLAWAGDLRDARLAGLLTGRERVDSARILHILTALRLTKHPCFLQLAFAFGRREQCACEWYEIYRMLAKTSGPLVDDYFVEYLVNDEGTRPDLSRLVNEYFRT